MLELFNKYRSYVSEKKRAKTTQDFDSFKEQEKEEKKRKKGGSRGTAQTLPDPTTDPEACGTSMPPGLSRRPSDPDSDAFKEQEKEEKRRKKGGSRLNRTASASSLAGEHGA